MRLLCLITLASLFLCGAGFGQALDDEGNLINDEVVNHGQRGPGDLLNRITTSVGNPDGLAYDGKSLFAVDDIIYIIDPATGATTGTVPITSTSEYGLGYDSTRNLWVTTNAGSDVVTTWDSTGLIVSQWPFPSTGYVGLAHDTTRDAYWVCDWSTGLVTAIDATTGAPGTAWDVAQYGATRCAGVGYDATLDALYVGGRDTGMIYVIAAASGNLLQSFSGYNIVSSNSPSGVACTGNQSCWHSNYSDSDLYELDTSPPGPKADIKCNGADAGVLVAQGANVKLDYDFFAGTGAGVPVDLWVVMNTPFGFFSYDGNGPISGWTMGLGTACFFTGPLADMNGNALDRPLPIGNYKAFAGADSVANGSLNLGSIVLQDAVDFEVKQFQGFTEDFNDGIADGWIDDGTAGEWFCTGGVYYLDCSSYKDWISYYGGFPYADFTYSADLRMIATTSVSNSYDRGLFFRSDGTFSNCYEANIDNDGNAWFYVHVGSTGGSSLYGAVSPNAVLGAGSWNTIKVDARGSNIDVYINGVLDYTVVDSTWTSGYVGLMGGGSGIYDHEYEFDNAVLTL